MFPNEFKKDNVKTVNAFLNDFFDNYDTIINKDDNINLSLPYQTIETIIQYEPDQKQKMVISKLIPTLNEIYIKYFSFELEKNKSLAKKSLQNLISFTRDFEIFPYIINQSQLVIYYNLITQKEINFQFSKKNIGELFTFDKFCIMIILTQSPILRNLTSLLGIVLKMISKCYGIILVFLLSSYIALII